MPKSSIAILIPSAQLWSERSVVAVLQQHQSVISSSSRRPAGPKRERIDDAAPVRLLNCAGDRLTAMHTLRPAPLRAQACRNTHSPSGTIRPVSSAIGMNSGRNHAALGMMPADEGLATGDLLGFDVDDGLIVKLELAIHERFAQIQFRGRGAPACARPFRIGGPGGCRRRRSLTR